jgi:hypothetical protein
MKKHIYRLFSVALAGLFILTSSCDRFLGDNIDPSALKQPDFPLVFTGAQSNLAFHMGSDIFLFSSIFAQQAAGQNSATQPRFFDQYIVTNTDVNNAFSFFYASELADMNDVITRSTAQGSPVYAGMSKIMQAYTFGVMVDTWGDLPYSDALKGAFIGPRPKYDDDQAIYESLFGLIDEGMSDLDQPSILKPVTQDLVYGGNITKWKRFGNTLKLRLALHYAKVDNGAKLKQLIGGKAADSFMTSNIDNFQVAFENNPNRHNPIDQFEVNRPDQYFPAAFMVNLMNTKNDPRRVAYFTQYPYNSGKFAGASTTAPTSINFSRIHTYLRGSITEDTSNDSLLQRTAANGLKNTAITYSGAAPVRMLTFAEYNFIRAEAALVYGAEGDATAFFKAGLAASLSDVEPYVAPVNLPAYTDLKPKYITAQIKDTLTDTSIPLTLKRIVEEKYIANFGVSVQPWTDFRRTGFPEIPVSAAAVAQGNTVLPRVLPYPLSEQSANPANVPARPSMAVKEIFWDK